MRKTLIAGVLLLAAVVVAGGATACGGSGGKKTSTPKPTAKATARATSTAAATRSSQTSTAVQTPVGTPSGATSQVNVTLVEYQVVPRPTSVPAGNVTFSAKNLGTTQHTLVVVKTEDGPTALPTKADGSYDDTAAGATVIDQVQPIDPSGSDTLTVNLEPGHYVLICNLVQTVNGQTVSHYKSGMTTDFTVTQ